MIPSSPLYDLQHAIEADRLTPATLQQAVPSMTHEHWAELFAWLASDQAALDAATTSRLIAAIETHFLAQPPATHDDLREAIATTYAQLPGDSPLKPALPRVLAAMTGPAELALLADLLASDPPADSEACALTLAPLLRRSKFDASPLFPRLLDAISHRQVAAAALDVANYLTRERFVVQHPASDRSTQLAALLGEITGRLTALSEGGNEPTADAAQQVKEGIGLVVSLCDALGQIGDAEVVGKLRQALAIMHRRVHAEAAFAMAKLGEKEGESLLVALASEPVARLRVLAYAAELGISDRIEEEFQSPTARAEAELAAWLSEPMQMGMSPHRIELVDYREQFWPGFDEPIDCYLFEYTYEFPGGELSNIAIVGPAVMGFTADLSELSPEVIYAAYAGWQAEHDDIYEVPIDRVSGQSLRQAEQAASRLQLDGFADVKPLSVGHFFEQRVLIAEATHEGVSGIATVDADSVQWRPVAASSRPLGAAEIYAIYKGKRLLEAFNA